MTTPNISTEWKIYIGQIIIGILGAIAILKGGDGNVLSAVIAAEAALGGAVIAAKM